MSTKTDLEDEIRQKEAELARLRARRDRLESIPDEPDEEPAVVFFEKNFGKKTTYSYTAVRVGEEWYITGNAPGRNPNPKRWEQLIEFACQAEKGPVQIWKASELELIEVEK